MTIFRLKNFEKLGCGRNFSAIKEQYQNQNKLVMILKTVK